MPLLYSSRDRSRLFRSPLLHFLVLGGTLFLVSRFPTPAPSSEGESRNRRPIKIDAPKQAELRNSFLEQMGRAPTAGEFQAILSAEVDEEILYREALSRGLLESDGGVKTRLIQKMLFLEGSAKIEDASALLERAKSLGLDEGDIVVRRILVQKMRLLGSTLDAKSRPSAEAIEAAYERQSETLREPDRRSLTQIFFSADRRAGSAQADALAAWKQLITSAGTDDAQANVIALGDPFPLGHTFEGRSERDLDRSFGARFGAETFASAPGSWSAPIQSAYGYHLVRVDRVKNGEIPPLETVRKRLRHQLEQERREEQLENLLSDLRTRYAIVLEASDHRPRTSLPGSPHAQKEAR